MSKADARTEAPLEGKQRTTSGSSSRRPERNSSNKTGASNEDNSIKKKSGGGGGSSHQARHSAITGKESQRNSGNRSGGRDSTHAHSSRTDRYNNKKEGFEHVGGRGKGVVIKEGGGHVRSHHGGGNRTHRFNNEASRKGHKGAHPSSKPKVLEGKDSGISVDEGSSPEENSLKHRIDDNKDDASSKSPLQASLEDDIGTDKCVGDIVKRASLEYDDYEGENDGTNTTTTATTLDNLDETLVQSRVYDREFLLALRECTKSLLTPVGFDKLGGEVSKDILKATHRHPGTIENTSSEDDPLSKHTSSLAFTRDYNDQKSNPRVSLMPQRRSFGSGCSWRDHPPSSKPSPGGASAPDSQQSKTDDSGSDGGGPWSVVGQSHSSNHKVINHVPYRSRQGGVGAGTDWKQGRSASWRDKGTDLVQDDDDEPEWMSFGPSDRYELMELKGIDEHEMEREARNTETKSRSDDKSSPDDSPSTSPLDKEIPKNDLVDSGLPSSCPNDEEEDGFILDGFDFKSALSMCRELASDSDDEEDKVDRDSLSKAKDTHELKNALISVLGITKEERNRKAKEEQMKMSVEKKALTLDEIEGQTASANNSPDVDQSAFNKFLASMNSSSGSSKESSTALQQLGNLTRDDSGLDQSSTLIKPHPPKPSKLYFPDKTEDPYFSPQDLPAAYQNSPPQYPTQFNSHLDSTGHVLNHPSRWPSNTKWNGGDLHVKHASPTQLLNPSPSSIGMHPHHLRQSKPHPQGGGGTSMGPGGMGSGHSNSNWVAEMEQLRISELNQMRYQNTQYHREERQRALMLSHQQQIKAMQQQKSSGSAPSLGFLPTSVMRHMHNSKPNQPLKDIARPMPPAGRMDHDQVGFVQHSEGSHPAYHQSPAPQHYQYPPQQYYSPQLPMGGYHQQHSARPQVQSMYMKSGSSPMKPGLY